MDIKEAKKFCKNWINANVHDGEDRSGAIDDRSYFTPDSLQELIDEMIEDLLIKEPEEWIPVSERLPEEEDCWCLATDGEVITTLGFDIERKAFRDWLNSPLLNLNIENVTHWKPLPEQPKETN